MPWAPKKLTRPTPSPPEMRGTANERGYDADWQRLRLAVLSREPFCRRCAAEGRTTGATLVDHIVPIRAGGARLDDANLQPLCVLCHAIKTADDNSFGK
jgi:5-methylcytosine-specific restriction protein A